MRNPFRRWFARAVLVAPACPLLYVSWRGSTELFDPAYQPGKLPPGIAVMEGIAVIVDGALIVAALFGMGFFVLPAISRAAQWVWENAEIRPRPDPRA